MSRRSRGGAALSLVLAVALATASVLAAGGAADASTRTEPLRATFDHLLPGMTASASWGLELDRAAVMTDVTTVESGPGDVAWSVWLRRPATGAVTGVTEGATGTRLPAGAYELHVSVAVADIPPAATSTLDGRIVFAATGGADGGETTGTGQAGGTPALPGTGGPLAMTGAPALALLLAAVATALVGLLLLLGAGRRRDGDEAAPSGETAIATSDVRRAP